MKINCEVADNVNVAFYQNAVPIVSELAIENGTGRDLSELTVHLSAEPAFLTAGNWLKFPVPPATHHDSDA